MSAAIKKEMKILITQPKPKTEKSPYFDLEKKFNIQLDFYPLFNLEGIAAKEFRKQKIDITSFSAVIFTSRNAIDHFFRLAEELKVTISQEMKYFCITEAVALYLQKFILYRKRKVFFGANGSKQGLFDVINKHKANESFLFISSENQDESDIANWLKNNKCKFENAYMYRTVDNDTKGILTNTKYDIICLFTSGSIKQILESIPDFKQGKIVFATFGGNTLNTAKEAGFKVGISAPDPQNPNMGAALDSYLSKDLVAK